MAEYIDRAKFLKECIKTFGNPSLQIKAIENIAEKCTVDAVEVVRCKDCKHYQTEPFSKDGEKVCYRCDDYQYTDKDDFCSCGERKE